MLLLFVKHGDRRIASQLVDLQTVKSFEMNMFKWYIKSPAGSKAVNTRSTKELMEEEGFCRVLLRGGIVKKDGCCTLYVKDVTDEHRKQDGFCEKIIIRCIRKEERFC